MKRFARIILAFNISLFALTALAQNGINSPYSRYGFGMLSDRATGFNKGMGGVAQGFRHGQQINVGNPASYSAIDSLTALFDLGLSVFNGNYKMGNLQQNAKNASFDYFAFQFRAFRHVGVTIGLLPYSNIKYSFASATSSVPGSETITSTSTFTGDGGLRQVFIGAGWQPFRFISVGVNAGYLYGDYTHTSNSTFSDASAFSMQRTYTADITTYKLDFGLQLMFPLTAKDQLTLGATYGLGHDLPNRAIRSTQTINGTTTTTTADTIARAFQLPHTFDIGLTYAHTNKWRIGADFSLEKWSDARFPSQDTNGTGAYTSTTGQLYDRMKVALGGEFTPNPYGRFLQRISYRAGGYYSQSYARADLSGTVTDKPYEYGVSAGVSVPIISRHIWGANTPRLNISFQWVHSNIPYLSHAGGHQNTLTENYLRLSVGLTFSERWFQKWKVQ